MASKCCRSTPRCADCPAVVAAAARAQRREAGVALLIAQVLAGAVGPRHELPESVVDVLATLDAARHPATA